MSTQDPDQLRAAHARLRAAEAQLAGATHWLLQQRRQALNGTPNPAALAAAINAFVQADAAAQSARTNYERMGGVVSLVTMLETAAKFLSQPAAQGSNGPTTAEQAPESYVPQEPERRRWQFARWLALRGRLSEYPA